MGCTRKHHEGPIEQRRKRGLTGGDVLHDQCLACLKGAGRKERNPRPIDLIGVRGWERAPRKRFGFGTGPGNSKRREAARFYRSRAWLRIRDRRLAHDNHECVLCGNPATDVDHITYERFGGKEKLEDLQSLCADHHREIRGARMMGSAA